ncbi:ectoine hydroxylase [Niveispirillum fermenti]|uniref:ectoine hydroxylase n=1 Tax=Niveispirillum fermenti TaxID=1233113 RepID=UPI003A85889E
MIDHYPSRQTDRASLLPRLDPVVHGTWTPQAPLTQEQSRFFDENGYLVLENQFDAAEIAALQAEAATLLAHPAGLKPETVITERNSKEVRSIFEIHRQNAMLAWLAADARLSEVARYLLADDVYIHQSRLNYKPGFQGKEFYWHSDFETWHVEDGMPRMRALSMSILLARNTPHNGPLMLIPGSHKEYLTCVGETPDDHYKSSLKKQEYGVPDEDSLADLANRHGIVAPTGEPGTVVIFDCNIMHGSNGNITPFPRANAFLVYNALSNRLEKPFGPATPRPDFIAARKDIEPVRPMAGPLKRRAA